MIHFFRRIRQKLLSENRFTRYLIYAIGEIALVMIGILLALQVNNWNEYQSQRKIEKSILLEMKGNLKSDLGDIRGNITFDSTNHSATLNVLNQLESNATWENHYKEDYGKLGWVSLFAENTAAYENLKTLGFNLISNDKLRARITYLYSTRYEYANEIFNSNNDFVFDNFHPMMITHISSETGNYFIKKPNDIQELSEDLAFKELLREDLFMKNYSIELNRKLEQEVRTLIELIENEISQ